MVDADQFRRAMGNFATGVTAVTLPEPYHGITVNAFASVSLDPPIVLVSIDHETETYERLDGGDEAFCVNVLAADQQHLGEHFARMADYGNPFEDESVRTAATGAPIFEESLSFLDCSLIDAVEAGDHTIYLGEIEAADVLRPDADALTYFRGAWGTLGD